MSEPVWAVSRRDPNHRVRFPGRENAERWLANRGDEWDIVSIPEDDPKRAAYEHRAPGRHRQWSA